MTEEEAKGKKICGPSMAGALKHNRMHGEYDFQPCMCLGSECMAWRHLPANDWPELFNQSIDEGRKIDAIRWHRAGTGSALKEAKDFMEGVIAGTIPRPTAIPDTNGYCGLAGKP